MTAATLPLVFTAPKRGKPPLHWADLTPEQRQEALGDVPAYRIKQIAQQYYGRYNAHAGCMSDLPANLRPQINEKLFPTLLTKVQHYSCDQEETVKTLWRLHDGVFIESVLMRYHDRATLCVSSQAGCGMACPFCATGQGGLQRNLSTGEIIEQVRTAAAHSLSEFGAQRPLSNIVFMGMGEPLANYNRVLNAVRQIISPTGFGISARSVTISTVGLVPAIERLTHEGLACTLAISLHAPDDELRNTLVPVNNRWPVEEVLSAAYDYASTTGRRISIEYALIKNVNDQPWRAELLGRILHSKLGSLVHVNVIPLNPTPGSQWDASDKNTEREFVTAVAAQGVTCTVRDTRGQEIGAACGQLAAESSRS